MLVFGLIIWYVTKPESNSTGVKGFSNFVEGIGNLFGGKR
jgi:hypothetical protein